MQLNSLGSCGAGMSSPALKASTPPPSAAKEASVLAQATPLLAQATAVGNGAIGQALSILA
ncbi:MAG: hypothetical protein ACK5T0_07095 [Vampirovibrionales bacterium]